MGSKDREYLENNIKFRKVVLMNGIYRRIETSALVGICHHPAHKGYVDVNLLNKHDCINKNCYRFERLEDYPFWVHHRNVEAQKQKRKEKARILETEKARKKASLDKKMENFKAEAQNIADRLDYPLIITRVAPLRENESGCYVINYVTDDLINNWSRYFELALRMRDKFGGMFRLKHMKNPYGDYITLKEWEEVWKDRFN